MHGLVEGVVFLFLLAREGRMKNSILNLPIDGDAADLLDLSELFDCGGVPASEWSEVREIGRAFA